MKVKIPRGLPGCGKSTWAKSQPGKVVIVSADTYFTNFFGEYHFRPELLGEAHRFCLKSYLYNLQNPFTDNPDILIVDNTNISAWAIAPYVALADLFKVEYEIITFLITPALSLEKNVHKVPANTIVNMANQMKREPLPGHWPHRIINSYWQDQAISLTVVSDSNVPNYNEE